MFTACLISSNDIGTLISSLISSLTGDSSGKIRLPSESFSSVEYFISLNIHVLHVDIDTSQEFYFHLKISRTGEDWMS